MKIYIALFTLLTSITAQAASGCLVRAKDKVVVDPKCKCLETKSCATQGKLNYSKKFFDAKKPNGTALFSEKEKVAYEKSYKLLNQIYELKSQGKADSPEIKKVYFELDKVNNEISILLHKNHPAFMAKQKKRYAEKSKQRKEQNAKRDKAIKEFLATKGKAPLAQQPTPAAKEIESIKNKPAPLPSVATEVSPARKQEAPQESLAKTDGLSDDDKKDILRKLNKEQLEVTEDDSLFDIISKTYKGKAYKKLWAPKDIEENPMDPKAP